MYTTRLIRSYDTLVNHSFINNSNKSAKPYYYFLFPYLNKIIKYFIVITPNHNLNTLITGQKNRLF